MERETGFLLDLSAALAIALAGGFIATRLRLSPIVGYIAAGIVISPFTPGFVGDVDRLRLIADIGVVLLLFGIGVQFSIGAMTRAGPAIMLAAAAQTAAVVALSPLIGALAGWSIDESLYIGAAAAIASSVVLVKVLEGRGEIESTHGRTAVAWSIVQDLCGVVLIVVLAAATSDGGAGAGVRDISVAAAKASCFVVATLVIGVRVVPPLMERIAEESSRELFYLAIAALALGTALLSEYAGLSLALGAFLAGLVVSESKVSHRVLDDLLPARDVFAVLFFVSVGMLIDPDVVVDEWEVVVLVLVIALPLRALIAGPALSFILSRREALLATAALAPAGEFSFLLADAGVDEGVLTEARFAAVIAATAFTIVISPAVLAAAHRLAERASRAVTATASVTPASGNVD